MPVPCRCPTGLRFEAGSPAGNPVAWTRARWRWPAPGCLHGSAGRPRSSRERVNRVRGCLIRRRWDHACSSSCSASVPESSSIIATWLSPPLLNEKNPNTWQHFPCQPTECDCPAPAGQCMSTYPGISPSRPTSQSPSRRTDSSALCIAYICTRPCLLVPIHHHVSVILHPTRRPGSGGVDTARRDTCGHVARRCSLGARGRGAGPLIGVPTSRKGQ